MRKKIFLLMILLLARPAFAADDGYSADAVRSFTRYLIGKKEYYRAYVEMKRLQSYYPGLLSPLVVQATESYLLFNAKQYTLILERTEPVPEQPGQALDAIFKYDAVVARGEWGRLGPALASWPGAQGPFLDRCFQKRRIFASVMARRYDEAAGLCGTGADFSSCRELIERARTGLSYEKKPWLAALLGIVPGMGYIYAGDTATGIFAFLLIAVDAVLTYFAFRTRNDVIGCFTGVIGGFLYAGSIAGGYRAVHRFNAGITGRSASSLSSGLEFEQDREAVFKQYGIGADGR